MSAFSDIAAILPSSPVTQRCLAVVPDEITAAGVWASLPLAINRSLI